MVGMAAAKLRELKHVDLRDRQRITVDRVWWIQSARWTFCLLLV